MSARSRTAALTIAVIAVVGASLSAELVLYSVNTPERHPEWHDSKSLLAAIVMGVKLSPKTRNLLHRDRLNLHEWFGNNEMLIDTVVTPSRLEFGFLLGEEAHVSAVFNKTRAGFSAIRLSRSPRHPSGFLKATNEGRFVSSEKLPDLGLDAGWHAARLDFDEARVALRIDGRPIGRFEDPRAPRQLVGFRGGLAPPVLIDDVRLTDAQGRVVLRESFRNRHGFAIVWLISFCTWLAIPAGLLLVVKWLDRDVSTWLMGVLTFGIVAIMLLGAVYAVDYFHFSRGYHYRGYMPWGVDELRRTEIEVARRDLFAAIAPAPPSGKRSAAADFLGRERMHLERGVEAIRTAGGAESIQFFPRSAEEAADLARRLGVRDGFRIVFLGSSQTWGAGAAVRTDRLVLQVHRRLVERLPASASLLTINAAANGSRLLIQSAWLRTHLHPLEPQLVVANLANNDPTKQFGEPLSQLADYCRQRGTKLLLVLEANDSAGTNAELVRRHAIMRDVAKRFGIPAVSLHDYLAGPEIRDSGYLWWDIVHMTSHGQRAAADFLSAAILRHFDFTADGKIVLRRGGSSGRR